MAHKALCSKQNKFSCFNWASRSLRLPNRETPTGYPSSSSIRLCLLRAVEQETKGKQKVQERGRKRGKKEGREKGREGGREGRREGGRERERLVSLGRELLLHPFNKLQLVEVPEHGS